MRNQILLHLKNPMFIDIRLPDCPAGWLARTAKSGFYSREKTNLQPVPLKNGMDSLVL